MKKLLITTALLIIGLCGSAKETKNPLMASDTVVWAGLDYSMVRMIGGNNFEYGFNVPDLIFPGMLEKWNQLFLDERVELVANALGKRVSVDIGGVTERNKAARAKQVILTPGPKDVIKESHQEYRQEFEKIQYEPQKVSVITLFSSFQHHAKKPVMPVDL